MSSMVFYEKVLLIKTKHRTETRKLMIVKLTYFSNNDLIWVFLKIKFQSSDLYNILSLIFQLKKKCQGFDGIYF